MAKNYDRQVIYREAEEYRAARKYKKAIKEYQKIIAIDPEDMQVLGRLADLFMMTGDRQQAIGAFEKVAAHFYKEELIDKVIAIRKQLRDLEPKKVNRHFDLGDLMVVKRLNADAIDVYRRALKIFRSRKYIDDCRRLWESIIKLKTDDFGGRLELSKIYLKLNHRSHAKRILLEGMTLMQGRRRSKWRWRYRWRLFRLEPSGKSFLAIFSG